MTSHRLYVASLVSGVITVLCMGVGALIVILATVHFRNLWLLLILIPIGFAIVSRVRRQVRIRRFRGQTVTSGGHERGD